MHIEMIRRVTARRTSYNIYLVNGADRFLCQNRPVNQARAYAEGLRRMLSVSIVEEHG